VSTSLRPGSYPGDAFFRAVERDEGQIDLVTARPASAISVMTLWPERLFPAQSPASIAATDGFEGLIFPATASGSSRRSCPSKPTHRVSVDLPDPFGPAINVRTGTRSGRADVQLADDLVVFP
jgi:hypothetical protein